MKHSVVELRLKRKLRNGVLITGLPGVGLIGRIAAEYIAEKLKARKVGELYSPHFPPQVLMTPKGIIKPIKSVFYVAKLKDKDLMIMVGDVQAIDPVGQYEVAGSVASMAKQIGVKEIITIGGYATGKLEGNNQIFGAATTKDIVSKFKKMGIVFGKAKGSIVGFAGLLPAIAHSLGIDAVCLMGTTHGSFVDPAASQRIVEFLSKYLGFKIDMSDLEKKAKEGQEIIKKVEEEIKKSLEQQTHVESPSYIR